MNGICPCSRIKTARALPDDLRKTHPSRAALSGYRHDCDRTAALAYRDDGDAVHVQTTSASYNIHLIGKNPGIFKLIDDFFFSSPIPYGIA
ncbi:MAG: hypothetical protein NTW33_05665, partial [Methanoregula sp.]|nr:hypothetical protein [Methanoregula sp.]